MILEHMETATNQAQRGSRPSGETLTWLCTAALLVLGSLFPSPQSDLLRATVSGLGALLPVVLAASLLAGALTVGEWSTRVMTAVSGGPVRAVVLASVAGTITPVCGLGVLPLITALLRRGLPLAPIMAFWISSPIMGPSMVVVTLGVLGAPFAAAKTLAALGAGLLAGTVTALLPAFRGPAHSLLRPGPLHGADCDAAGFWREAWNSARLVLRWLALALVLEVLVQRLVPEDWIEAAFGDQSLASVPLAAIVGAPLYVDGYAALPLVRSFMEMGMSFGAALAFMISGAAVSLYAFVAVIAIVRTRVVVLYLCLAVLGAVASGYVAQWLTG